ncbi:MFS transporter [Amycolatopsis thermophila]|uniref:EmrB/QacA subfamily drug resistance transporter n=1 Tax=Amycolatopsis thermophila TaxID=206084 RepID=A0ABU0F342_9PSEU|nr:MFS transporter [Amycolatopsis thermophila]MDQ0381992.1 EmrB/QacA subfamily drug resistance transporter [Amycolatopsis thermophila]
MSHAHHAPEAAAGAPPHPRRWTALVLLCLAQFMLIVDITVVQVALPTIGTDLALGRDALTWVVTTYTLAFGGLMVFGGRLADAFGARRTLLTGLVLFTLASLLCGLANTGGVLITGRALQGIGAALLSPSALSIITSTFTGRERNRALGVWAAIGGSGAAAGVLLSGLLTAGPGWEWVFFVNVPIGVLVVLVLPSVVPANGGQARRAGVDLPGAIAVTLATGLLIYALVHAGDAGWGSAGTVLGLGGSVLAYAAFGWIESRTRHPLMTPSAFARRPVLSGTFLMLIATGVLLGLFFLTSLYFQHVLGFSALKTGLLFLPVALAITLGAQLAAHLLGKVGGRPVAVGAFVLTAVGASLLTRIDPAGSVYTGVLPGFLIAALGLGPLFVTATSTTLANVGHTESGVASGVINTFHELGGSIGVAVVSTVAAGSIAGDAGVGGFTAAYLLCAIAAPVAAVVAAVLVPAGKPRAVAGHGH